MMNVNSHISWWKRSKNDQTIDWRKTHIEGTVSWLFYCQTETKVIMIAFDVVSWADNSLEAEGTVQICTALKTNTTLTSLDLFGYEWIRMNKKQENHCYFHLGTRIGEEGATMVGEVLKINTSLTCLNLLGTNLKKKEAKLNECYNSIV